jgi:hypothetical protein
LRLIPLRIARSAISNLPSSFPNSSFQYTISYSNLTLFFRPPHTAVHLEQNSDPGTRLPRQWNCTAISTHSLFLCTFVLFSRFFCFETPFFSLLMGLCTELENEINFKGRLNSTTWHIKLNISLMARGWNPVAILFAMM